MRQARDSSATAGWAGKPKGIQQILFESGWLKAGMVAKIDVVDKNTKKDKAGRGLELCGLTTLRSRPDFFNEMSELEKILTERGHILVMSPKCHPELAFAHPRACHT